MTAPSVPLTRAVKAGYGAADLGMAGVEVLLQLFLLEFYTRSVGLSASLVGYALGIAVAWDAITDPLMGTLSDRTRTRWGMRRPYMLAGGLVFAIAIPLLFWPPALATQGGKFAYLLITYLLLNTGYTILSVPYTALAGEMTTDRVERTELFGWRLLAKNGGFLIGALAPGLLYNAAEPNGAAAALQESRGTVAWVLAGIVLVTVWISTVAVRRHDTYERALARTGGTVSPREMLYEWRGVLCNPLFLPMVIAFVIAQSGRTINASLGIYYYKIFLGLTERDIAAVLGAFIVSVSLSVVLWLWVSKRIGKKRAAFTGALSLGLLTMVTYPFLPPGQLLPVLIFASGLGGLTVGSVILFEALVADAVDYDELKTGRHREGLYYGIWTMATKFARAAGLAMTGILLDAIGLDPAVSEHSPELGWRIALLFGPGVGLWFVLAALVFLLLPHSEAKQDRIQALLRRRAARRRTP
jgi:GPH family glycoside/pentoside/hexuronide:cation symporter